jgi:hypothetical protein
MRRGRRGGIRGQSGRVDVDGVKARITAIGLGRVDGGAGRVMMTSSDGGGTLCTSCMSSILGKGCPDLSV